MIKKSLATKILNTILLDMKNSLSDITFIYDNTRIMYVKVFHESTKKINKEKLINELIENYKIIV